MWARFWFLLSKILRHAFTGKDNTTHDLAKYAFVASLLAVFAHDGWQIYLQRRMLLFAKETTEVALFSTLNVKDLALAISTIVVAYGVTLNLKAKTEPEPKEKSDEPSDQA